MNQKKLDGEHVFLQFLMMFFVLSILLIFSVFVKNLLWFDNAEKAISLSSAVFSLFLLVVIFLRYRVTIKQKGSFSLSHSLFVLGFSAISSVRLQSLDTFTQILITVGLIVSLFVFLVYFFRRKNWIYSNLDFWIIFALSLFLFSRMFLLENLLNEGSKLLEYSSLVNLFGRLALTVGFVNDLREVKIKQKGAKKRKKR